MMRFSALNISRNLSKWVLLSKESVGNVSCASFYSTQGKSVEVEVDNEGIGVVSMKKPPVNSLNLEFNQELQQTIKELENSKTCKGIVLTSSVPNIFSGGLDIMEMYKPSEDRLRKFWSGLQQLWMDLYLTKLVTIAAITGHSPAGGCLLAVSSDYRIMVKSKYTIGLNETLLGIVAPFWFQASFVNVVGHRKAEYAMSLGKLYNAEEALQIGLVDKLASTPEEAINEAKTEMKKWIKIPRAARIATKQQLRQATVQQLVKRRDQDIDNFVGFVSDPNTQKFLGAYLEALKKKKECCSKFELFTNG